MWRKRDYRKCESRFCDGKQRIEELEAENAALKNVGVTRHADDATLAYIAQLEQENAAQKRVCRNVYEVWAGSEGIPEPETCPEAYLLQLVEQMRDEAKAGLE